MFKNIRGGFRDWLLIAICAALFLTALLLPVRMALAAELTQEEKQLLEAFESGQLIRLHVVANSDSPEDQAVKLKVRDHLISVFGSALRQAGDKSCEAVFDWLQTNAARMEEEARLCAAQHGFHGPVAAEAGILWLPQKQYGNVTLPAGEYQALRITLGSGEGQNWWCVLFPQLCLALAETGDAPPAMTWDSQRILRHWLLWAN